MTLAVTKWERSPPMSMGKLRGEKGSASPPCRRQKEMAEDNSEYENAHCPVDMADIWNFPIGMKEISKTELPSFFAECCIREPIRARPMGPGRPLGPGP